MPFAVRRRLAWVALVAFLGGFALPYVETPHLASDPDREFAGPALGSGHPITQFEPVRAATQPEHCVLCHWLSALGQSAPAARTVAAPPPLEPAVVQAPACVLPSATDGPCPVRGPPASFLA